MKPLSLDWALLSPLPSAANLRESWAKRMLRVKASRRLTRFHFLTRPGAVVVLRDAVSEGSNLTCTLTRIAAKRLDDDNLAFAFKAIRDEVAAIAKIDDGSPRWTWRYQQERGKPGVRITIEVAL